MVTTRSIELRTEVPGPRARQILEREQHAVARPLIVHGPIVADSASGATITDVDGNTFLDFVGGVGVMNVGHNHPRVVEAVNAQVERFLHTDFTVVAYEPYIELAERLGALAPIAGDVRSAFFNAGTEAVENAVKLARLYTGRQAVIAFEGAFHGRTYALVDDDVSDASVQDWSRPVRAGGLSSAVSQRLPGSGCRRGSRRARANALDARLSRTTSPRSSSRRSKEREGSFQHQRHSSRGFGA